MTRTAVVVGGNRTPFAKAGTAYANVSAVDLLIAALDGLVARFGLAGAVVDEVVAGAVIKHSRDVNLTREAVLGSALSPLTPACDVQQACATGVETVIYASNKIQLGQANVAIAGGVDSASDVPITVSEGLRRALLRLNRARSVGEKVAALAAIRPRDLVPTPPAVEEPRTGLSMGESQAITTRQWGIPREDQDALALASHQNLDRAWREGFFDDLVTGYCGLSRDGVLREDTTLDKLAALRPVFGRGEDATMTAGNSTTLTDGASTVLLSSAQYARERSWPMLAKVIDAQVAAIDYVTGAEGLLMAPVRAIPQLLERTGLTLQDFDFYEFHEAFAGTVLSTLKALEDRGLGAIDRAKLNVDGSSLAAGHPFAATGGRIVASLAKRLSMAGSGSRGLISVCAAGGQGVAMILEGL